MHLREVRRWAGERRIPASDFRRVHEGAFLHALSRLLQAMYRESDITRLARDGRGRWQLEIGSGAILRVPVSGPLPFRRLEITGRPVVIVAGKRRAIHTSRAFLAALERCVAATEYEAVFSALSSDFENSVANVTLNRLIGRSLTRKACAIEPAYQGHQYYPFPALRIGPSLAQVVECSHLSQQPVGLPLLEVSGCRVVTCEFETYSACMRAWSGLKLPAAPAGLLPVHPWQLVVSPIVREMLARKFISLSEVSVQMIPLASQRTCRIVRTGFDVKLALNATITGEQRLLYRLNCANAPIISSLVKHLLASCGLRTIDFQQDVASIFHDVPAVAPHLSAIVRAPVRAQPGETIVAAINLWTGREEARALLRDANAARIEEFFRQYCRVLMEGPVAFCTQFGVAFEPHIQNVYIGFRDGVPSRAILRDLDASILDPRRVRPVLRALGVEVAKDTWHHMPGFELGARRFTQAMLFGHIGEVMWKLTQTGRVQMPALVSIVNDTWNELEARAPSRGARNQVRRLRAWSDDVKATLRTRLHRAKSLDFLQ